MALRSLSLVQSVLPQRFLRRSWSLARRRVREVVRALLTAILARFERLLGPPDAYRRPPTGAEAASRYDEAASRADQASCDGPLALTGRPALRQEVPEPEVPRVTDAEFLDPTWLDGLLTRVRGTRSGRSRKAAMDQTLADLERLIPLMERTGIQAAGLLQSYRQLRLLQDPDRASSGFELNMAWVLLERELKSALSAC